MSATTVEKDGLEAQVLDITPKNCDDTALDLRLLETPGCMEAMLHWSMCARFRESLREDPAKLQVFYRGADGNGGYHAYLASLPKQFSLEDQVQSRLRGTK